MLQPALISFIALVLLTVALFVAVRKKWIKDDTLNSLATVATIIAGLASILNFILFVDFGDDPGPTPTVDAAAPTITATQHLLQHRPLHPRHSLLLLLSTTGRTRTTFL